MKAGTLFSGATLARTLRAGCRRASQRRVRRARAPRQGVYSGGLEHANALVLTGRAEPHDFKLLAVRPAPASCHHLSGRTWCHCGPALAPASAKS